MERAIRRPHGGIPVMLLLIGSAFLVLPSIATPAKADTPSVTLSASSGPPGTVMTVTGSGFPPDSTEFEITICCQNIGGLSVSSAPYYCPSIPGTGSFECDYGILWNSDAVNCALSLIPGQPTGTSGKISCVEDLAKSALPISPGPITINVQGEVGLADHAVATMQTASAPFTVTTPSISLSSSAGAPGSQVTITGSGFANTDQVGTVTLVSDAVNFDCESLTSIFTSTTCINYAFNCQNFFSQTTTAGCDNTFASNVSQLPTTCKLSQGTLLPCTITMPTGLPGTTYEVQVTGDNQCDCSFAQQNYLLGPSLKLFPDKGPVGTTVTVTGSNFAGSLSGAPDASISFGLFDGLPVLGSNTCPVSQGSFSCSFQVPPLTGQLGANKVTVCGDALDCVDATFTLTNPGYSMNPSNGPPGTQVTISGSGFAASDQSFNIRFGNTNVTPPSGCPVSSTAAGAFSCVFIVPSGYVASTFVYVTGNTGDTLDAFFPPSFYVTEIGFFSPPPSHAGGQVTLTAAGYSTSDQTSTVTLDGVDVTPTGGCPQTNGYVQCTITVPQLAPGVYPLVVTGGATGDTGSTLLQVNPNISLTPTSGPSGDSVTVSGTGFDPSDTSASLLFNGSPVSASCPVTLSGSLGSIHCTFAPPSVSPGSYKVTAKGNQGNAQDLASASFQLTVPYVTSVPYSGPFGQIVSVTATGLSGADSSATLSFAGSATGSCSQTGPGSFTCGLVVPVFEPNGVYQILVTGSTGDSASTSYTVTTAVVSLDFTMGPAGLFVTVTSSGFPSNDQGTTLSFGTQTIGSQDMCPMSGGASSEGCGFNVPSVSPGTYPICEKDDSGVIACAPFKVTVEQATATPAAGPAGSTVTISGTGFPGSSIVPEICFGAALTGNTFCNFPLGNTSCPLTDGAFSCSFQFPQPTPGNNAPPGAYAIDIAQSGFCGLYSSCSVAPPTFTVTVPTITLSQTSGQTGQSVTVTGTGFSYNDSSAAISFDGTTVTPASKCPVVLGGFSCPFIVPSTSAGSHTVSASGGTGDSASTGFTDVAPTISLLVTSGPAGTSVLAFGSGFSSSDTTISSLTLGSTTLTTSGCTVSGGVLASCAFVIPSSPAGTFAVTAVGGPIGDSASAQFTVTIPSIEVFPTSGPAGIPVTVTAAGLSFADASATITFNGVNVTPPTGCATPAISAGSFTCIFTVPPVTDGQYTVTLTGNTLHDAVSTTFTVVPTITVSPSSADAGATVTVTGSGFAVSDTSATLSVGSFFPPSPCAVIQGSFSCSFNAPSMNPGEYAVVAKGSTGDSASASFTLLASTISLTPSSGPSGTQVLVSGTGFPAVESYASVTFGTNTVVGLNPSGTSSCPISGLGVLTCAFMVPTTAAPGAYSVTVNDNGIGSASATFTVTAASISLSAISGPAGSSIVVTGSGFSPQDTVATLTFGGALLSATGCEIAGGSLSSCTFLVPADASGSYIVTATGNSGDTGSATFKITTASISVFPASGPSGLVIAVSGSGFSTADGTVTLTFNGTPGYACAASEGYLLCSTPVPALSPGTYDITVTGGGGDQASTPFTITVPQLSLSPSAGPAGTVVTVAGSGYPDAASFATITIGTVAVVSPGPTGTSSCPVSSAGSLSCTFVVPGRAPGPSTVTVSDFGTASASATFTVTVPSITASPPSASAGSQTAVAGSGFELSDTSATIILGGSVLDTGCPVSLGSFSCLVTVPATIGVGMYTLTAAGNSGNPSDTASATFDVKFPTITTTALSKTTISAGQSVTDTATIFGASSPTGTISFYYSTSNSCPETGATEVGSGYPVVAASATSAPAIFPIAGTYYWYAVYSGDASNAGATSLCETLTVQSSGMSASYSATSPVIVGGAVSVSATIKNTGQTDLSSLSAMDGEAGALTCGATTLPSGGSTTCTGTFTAPSSAQILSDSLSVTATDSNGLNVSASASATVQVQDFALVATPSSVAFTAGSSGTSTISLNNLQGFSGVVALSIGTIPAGLTASLSSPSISGSATSTLTLSTPSAGTYTLTVTGTSGAVTRTATVTIVVSYANCPQVSDKGGQNLKGADLEYCNLAGYNMAGDNLMDANMQFTDLQNTDLQGANLMGADLANSYAPNASFQGANLMRITISGATLSGDNFQGANLMASDLSHVSAEHADFQGANLMKSNLSNGDFDYANFTGANTKGANTSGATFVGAINPP